jgi:hypothetical protein
VVLIGSGRGGSEEAEGPRCLPLARVEGHWPADLPPAPVDAPRVGRYIVDVRSFEMLALPELESATAASGGQQVWLWWPAYVTKHDLSRPLLVVQYD